MTRIDLGTLGGASSYATDINNDNVVVGWSDTRAGATHAFRWSPAAGMVDLGTLPGDAMSRAVAILDGGATGGAQVLGVSGDDGRWTPVVWSASGSITVLPIGLIPGFTTALPTDFNARGEVVGSDAGGFQHGWVWSATAGKYDLSANVAGGSYEGSAQSVTASGSVLLTAMASNCQQPSNCWRTYLWAQSSGYQSLGTPRDEPAANVTGLAMSEAGSVVGWIASAAGSGTSPYRWDKRTGFTVLARYPGSDYGYATAVNASGAVVGAALDPATGSIVASTWLARGGIVKLSPDDANPSVAIAINTPGTIAGWAGISNGVNHAVIWQASSAPHTALTPPTSVSAARVSSPSSPCLADARSITSRQSLFACVIKADHKR